LAYSVCIGAADRAIIALGAHVSSQPPVLEDMAGKVSHDAQASLVFALHAERAENAQPDF